jgi:hypothetical protein
MIPEGFVEAQNSQGEEYGLNKLMESVKANTYLSALEGIYLQLY